MPKGDRRIRAYLNELVLNRELAKALAVSNGLLTAKRNVLNGGELARVLQQLNAGDVPAVTLRVKYPKKERVA